jgi:hypothetical protein
LSKLTLIKKYIICVITLLLCNRNLQEWLLNDSSLSPFHGFKYNMVKDPCAMCYLVWFWFTFTCSGFMSFRKSVYSLLLCRSFEKVFTGKTRDADNRDLQSPCPSCWPETSDLYPNVVLRCTLDYRIEAAFLKTGLMFSALHFRASC